MTDEFEQVGLEAEEQTEPTNTDQPAPSKRTRQAREEAVPTASPEPEPESVTLVWKGFAHFFHWIDGTLFPKGQPVSVAPAVASEILASSWAPSFEQPEGASANL